MSQVFLITLVLIFELILSQIQSGQSLKRSICSPLLVFIIMVGRSLITHFIIIGL